MFESVLIANRGEIACRVMATARRMGLRTVAVYSEADAGAMHVDLADAARLIGPAPARDSYLNIAAVVAAARAAHAEAIHPGYGFLAENADFAEACAEAGIVFVGPPAAAIRAMGSKIEAKRIMEDAGVPVVPGFHEPDMDDGRLAEAAAEIGYPVMLKASAGGGGKGMRIAGDAAQAREGFVSAASEAESSFGDGRILIEKFIENPRHIEIQLLADADGNAVHLGERECSIQRRHQKVIEEAPSPFLDAAMRAAMGAQAVALAHAVGYRSAGTVEFIVDTKKNFYFLEMNTRLQVEHPVTELVARIDLVEQMIRIAAGEPLGFGQEDVRIEGWAIEARIYAEDPSRGFLPAPGRIERYRPPAEADGVRIDSGVYEGADVSVFYDPLIAKLCAWGEDRGAAIARMRAALDAFELRGPGHNIALLAAVMRNGRFVEGRFSTAFIAEEYGDAFDGAPLAGELLDTFVAVAALVHLREQARANRISGQAPYYAWRPGGRWVVSLDGAPHAVAASAQSEGVAVEFDGRRIVVGSDWRPGASLFEGVVDGRAVTVQVEPSGGGYRLSHAGARPLAVVRRARAAELAARMPAKAPPDRSRLLLSPMPGRVVSIAVEAGQEVKAGEPLCVVDAMKMENILRAERDGRVARVVTGAGESVEVDQVILELE
ncbi:MAG: acetyl/propionyl/methylcrotonyl-CoA carboxylase subunit alpha [Proteobacteria bacterium]|nr:acetyl/propionyl/methylcrotonyl-CoA carboxylase subunit alpha [Pseudomonadota bacterium]